MKITVKVHPKSKVEKIEKISDTEFEIFFNVPPENNRANRKVVEMLAEYFEVSLSQVYILIGSHSKMKVFEIVDKDK